MKRRIHGFSVVTLAFAACGCAALPGESEPPASQDLTGAFVSPAGYAGTFMAEGYFSVVNPRRVTVLLSEYEARDGVIRFRDLTAELDATQDEARCTMTNNGTYSYAETGGSLEFTLIDDPCPSRIELVMASGLTRLVTEKRP